MVTYLLGTWAQRAYSAHVKPPNSCLTKSDFWVLELFWKSEFGALSEGQASELLCFETKLDSFVSELTFLEGILTATCLPKF